MPEQNRWKQRPPGSNWGDFGPDDQRGRLNLLTPERVRRAAAEIHDGQVFCLSLPLDRPGGNVLNPRRHPPVLRPTLRNGLPNYNYRMQRDDPAATDVLNDDAVILHTQYSTQWDGLSHVGQLFDADADGVPEAVYYNGFRAGTDVVGPSDPADAGATGTVPARTTAGARQLGIEKMAETGVQGRGVMIDLHAHVGRDRVVIGYEQLMRIMQQDGVVVEPGDMVCLHTGFGEMLMEMEGKPSVFALENTCPVLDGADPALLDWITESGLSVLIADNYAVEAHPATRHYGGCCAMVPLHEHCLFKLGIHLGELWYLSELATWLRSHDRSRFFLTAPPLRLPGAVGSPVTPVGTV